MVEELTGTRLKIYYFLLSQGKPMSLRKIQRELNISSPSVVQYHIKRLMEMGLVSETDEGYVVSKVILEDYVRIRSSLLPKSLFLSSFFVTSLIIGILLWRETEIALSYSLSVIGVAAAITIIDFMKKRRKVKF
ncbi:winged helix-turn-helix domain-containing protein [Sulfodiicoccus acidiphilus]|uniref:winged helix-turn-helix domain-containing protein n=1 Tax=Sulfodiicoccus acidiphilus TaxID=1670455 RepID=UPI000F825118